MQLTASLLPRDGVVRGLAFALFSYASFATADAIIKLSSSRFSVFQIGLILAIAALGPALALTRGRGGWRALVPRQRRLVFGRAVLTAAGAFCAWSAFGMLPLAEGYALLFMAPMIVTALAALLLREQVGWRRWLATIAGFVGVIIILNPNFETLALGHALAGCAAVLGSFAFLILRMIGKEETGASIIASLFIAVALAAAVPAWLYWVPPTVSEIGMLALAGLLMGAGQAGVVFATREAPAALVAPFQYTQMLWAVAFGIVLFGDLPTPNLFAGMAIIVASGLFVLWRETVRERPVTLTVGRGEVAARVARH